MISCSFDGDTYESTLDVLENAYHKLARGAFFIIDDWCVRFEFAGVNGVNLHVQEFQFEFNCIAT